MSMRLVQRNEVYETFWRFASERQRIFERRIAGEPGPWTDDSILRTYKFCNAFRASDRVSQYLIRDVIYGPGEYSPEDMALRIVLFRLFSRERTWQLIDQASNGLSVRTFDPQKLSRVLDHELAQGNRIYTAAFILCANNAFGHARKHDNHLALVSAMLTDRALWKQVANARSLQQLYEALLAYPLIGPFMAYQLAIDLNYSELVDFDESEFTVAGPGAKRGIRKVFESTGGMSDSDVIHHMTDAQHDACEQLDITPPTLFGRPLQAIDVQNLFCEVDKYSRVAFPQLRSDRTRIKASFVPSSESLVLRYPPKWNLSSIDRVQEPIPSPQPELAAI